MLQEMKDYAKCAIRNKFIIGSYAGIGLSFLIKYIERETGTQIPVVDGLLCYVGSVGLGATKFGSETFNAYRRMRKHIAEHGTIKPRFKDKFSSLYCTQIGIKMAAEEAGLENLI